MPCVQFATQAPIVAEGYEGKLGKNNLFLINNYEPYMPQSYQLP